MQFIVDIFGCYASVSRLKVISIVLDCISTDMFYWLYKYMPVIHIFCIPFLFDKCLAIDK